MYLNADILYSTSLIRAKLQLADDKSFEEAENMSTKASNYMSEISELISNENVN